MEVDNMAKERNVACIFYKAETHCRKNREGTFYHYCQKCNLYNPIKGGKPARTNNKKQKLDRVRQKEGYNYD